MLDERRSPTAKNERGKGVMAKAAKISPKDGHPWSPALGQS